ncbi:MAG: hypothetical protein RTU30_11610 [Candidatus Thorarchaeota archaeon]
MSSNDSPEELEKSEKRANELYAGQGTYGYVSEEFWKDFDELKVLLLDSIQMAHRLGREETASRFQSMFDEIMENIPSGYWK